MITAIGQVISIWILYEAAGNRKGIAGCDVNVTRGRISRQVLVVVYLLLPTNSQIGEYRICDLSLSWMKARSKTC